MSTSFSSDDASQPEVVTFATYVPDLRESLRFYIDELGLKPVVVFPSMENPMGAILEVNAGARFELLQRTAVAETGAQRDHIVLRFNDPGAAARLLSHGLQAVAPVNPYWVDRATVFEDPSGRQIVLDTGTGS